MILNELDQTVPGKVYLCQVNEKISCGACCGLYNVIRLSRTTLTTMLARRTQQFARVSRNVEAILEFGENTAKTENQARPLARFHHCPYLGLVGNRQLRVGCMLHPLAHGNNGVDFRGLSYYGGMACRVYFCPSYHRLSSATKMIIRLLASDWYRFGLLVTETVLLQAIFDELALRIGRDPLLAELQADAVRRDAMRNLLEIKFTWPFRLPNTNHLVNYFFEDGEHPSPQQNISQMPRTNPRFRTIIVALQTDLSECTDWDRSEAFLETHFRKTAEAFRV